MRGEMNRAELSQSAMASSSHPHVWHEMSAWGMASGPQKDSMLKQSAFISSKILLDNPKPETQGNFLQKKTVFICNV